MKFRPLTEKQLNLLDPTHKARSHYDQFHDWIPGPRGFTTLTDRDIRDHVNNMYAFGSKHHLYADMNQELLAKVGPQGGMRNYDDMVASLSDYYVHAYSPNVKQRLLQVGRDFLLQMLQERLEEIPFNNGYEVKFESTSASLPTMRKKGDYLAETVGFKSWRHPLPNLLGQRHQRNSFRSIFMDPVANVRYVEPVLHAVKAYLLRVLPHFFRGWQNAHTAISPIITPYVLSGNSVFVETDYVKMDQHLNFDIVAEYILPIYELLYPDAYISFASAIEELYEQPILLKDGVIEGRHATFSGQGQTNDFETLYTLELWLGAILLAHIPLDEVLILVNGDDAAVAMRNVSVEYAKSLTASVIDASNTIGMELHPLDSLKTKIRTQGVAFCRQLYYPAGRKFADGSLIGAYPSVLALNNIVNPERPNKASIMAVADLQRLDGLIGSIDYYHVVDKVISGATHQWIVSDEAVAYVNARDWWQKLYGERWNPESSPSYRLIASRLSRQKDICDSLDRMLKSY